MPRSGPWANFRGSCFRFPLLGFRLETLGGLQALRRLSLRRLNPQARYATHIRPPPMPQSRRIRHTHTHNKRIPEKPEPQDPLPKPPLVEHPTPHPLTRGPKKATDFHRRRPWRRCATARASGSGILGTTSEKKGASWV